MLYLVLKNLPSNFTRISVFLINVSFWARLIWCIRMLNNSCNFCINISNISYLIFNLCSFLLTVAVGTKQVILDILFSISVTTVLRAVLLTDLFVLRVVLLISFGALKTYSQVLVTLLPSPLTFVSNFSKTLFLTTSLFTTLCILLNSTGTTFGLLTWAFKVVTFFFGWGLDVSALVTSFNPPFVA